MPTKYEDGIPYKNQVTDKIKSIQKQIDNISKALKEATEFPIVVYGDIGETVMAILKHKGYTVKLWSDPPQDDNVDYNRVYHIE